MHVKSSLIAGAAAAAVGFGALAGAGAASADPPPWVPGNPGYGNGHDGGHRGDDNRWYVHGQDDHDGDAQDRGRGDDGDWQHRYDREPPWGWGPPPRADFRGPLPPRWGPPPAAFNYWGTTVTPVWDDGYNTWGFWLFGVFIPLVSVG